MLLGLVKYVMIWVCLGFLEVLCLLMIWLLEVLCVVVDVVLVYVGLV